MSAGSIPNLRLVGLGDQLDQPTWSQHQKARLEVIKENRLAAHGSAAAIDPRDPRWRLAMQTQSQLEGSILAPERRDRLMRNARQLGLRPFEANLIIAIVQDKARRGYAATLGQSQPKNEFMLRPAPAVEQSASAPANHECKAVLPTNRSPVWECVRLVAALLASSAIAIMLARLITQH